MLIVEGVATLKSLTTGEEFTVDSSDLDFEIRGSDERGMGPEALHMADIDFDDTDDGTISCEWTVSEYPVGVLNHVSHTVRGCEVVKDFTFSIEDPSDDE